MMSWQVSRNSQGARARHVAPRAARFSLVSAHEGAGIDPSPLGQNSKAQMAARLITAPTIVWCSPVPIESDGTATAANPSATMSAIHTGMMRTGFHPISRMRMACRLKVTHRNRMVAAMTGRPIKLAVGSAPLGRVTINVASDREDDERHHAGQNEGGDEIVQPAEPHVEAEDHIQHGGVPAFVRPLYEHRKISQE